MVEAVGLYMPVPGNLVLPHEATPHNLLNIQPRPASRGHTSQPHEYTGTWQPCPASWGHTSQPHEYNGITARQQKATMTTTTVGESEGWWLQVDWSVLKRVHLYRGYS